MVVVRLLRHYAGRLWSRLVDVLAVLNVRPSLLLLSPVRDPLPNFLIHVLSN
jgi:hypothetical protein